MSLSSFCVVTNALRLNLFKMHDASKDQKIKNSVVLEEIQVQNITKQEEKIMDLMQAFTEKYKKAEPPVVAVGDTVRVHLKVKEGNRERIQVFEGTVIAKKHGGIEETFTVRRVSYGVGVEKVFPVHAPSIEKIELVRHGKVRRAKLYYLRNRVGKAAKVKEAL